MNKVHFTNALIAGLDDKRQKLKQKQAGTLPYYILIPLVFLMLGAMLGTPGPGLLFGSGFIGLLSFIVYYTNIILPFNEIKHKLKSTLLDEFFRTYHPEIQMSYEPEKQNVKQIIQRSGLIKPHIYKEEDVITGKMEGANFYLSEIHLKRRTDKSTYTIFRGMMFEIEVPGKQFPSGQIQTKPNLLKQLFGGFLKNDEYDFYYETNSLTRFNEELSFIFPFIKHLKSKQGDVRVKFQGNKITILLESKMKFLDNPKPSLGSSFNNPQYFENIGKQINTLLFIVESFVNNLSETEVEERLELKAIEYIKTNPLE